MAAKRNSRTARKPKASQVVVTPKFADLPAGDPRLIALARNVDAYLDSQAQSAARTDAEAKKRRAAEQRGISMKGERLAMARSAARDIGMAATAIHRLSITSVDDSENGEWYAVGIENTAKVIARKADVLLAFLGEPFGCGNFADELEPVEVRMGADHGR